jgi:hypothetical protein
MANKSVAATAAVDVTSTDGAAAIGEIFDWANRSRMSLDVNRLATND